MTSPLKSRVAALVVVAMGLALAACDAPSERAGVTTRPVDVVAEGSGDRDPVLAALLVAKARHQDADDALAAGHDAAAITALERIFAIPAPGADTPEWDATLLDARARIASVHLAAGELDAAERAVRAGLASARRPSFFHANLHALLGEVLEARALKLTQAPGATADDLTAARGLKRDAIVAHEASLTMNLAIQRRLAKEASP